MTLSIMNLLLVLLVAWLAGMLTSRIGYPSVLGELFAGIIFGPPLLGLVHGSEALTVLAELGILVMMLYIGMEIDPKELGKASKGGVLAAIGGFITPFVLCYLLIIGTGGTQMAAIFVGVASGVTSLAMKSRILVDLQLLDTRIAHVMMAGALIADTLSLAIFAVVISAGESGQVAMGEVALILLRAAVFFLVATVVGMKLLPIAARWMEKRGTTVIFTFVIIVGLLFAEASELAGMHGVLGAFFGGLFLREQVFGRTLSRQLMEHVRHASIGLLAPIFYVTAGFAVSLDVFTTDLGLLLAVIGIATVGKIAGTALFYLATGFGWREGLVIGAGMNGRGAIEIVVAQIGLSLGLISQSIFSILVFMALGTILTVPPLLKWGTDWLRRRGELVRSEGQREGVLIVGAGATARALGRILARSQAVWLVDRNAEHTELARQDGLSAVVGDALDERVLAEAHASRVRVFIALTPNPEVNALTARLAREVFLVPDVHMMDGRGRRSGYSALADHLRITRLFGGSIDLDEWDYRLEHEQADIDELPIGSATSPSELIRRDATPAIILAIQRDAVFLPFHEETALAAGDRVILLQAIEQEAIPLDRFDRLVRRAPILDVEHAVDARAFFQMAAAAMALELDMSPDTLATRFMDREAVSSTIILPGMAVPHVILEGEHRFSVLLARCREGIQFPDQTERVHAIFVLAGTLDERNFHLRALAAIASVVQAPEFESSWHTAPDVEALRDIVLRSPRRRLAELP